MGALSFAFWIFAFLPVAPIAKTADQRANIKFLLHAGNTPIQIWHALEAVYGDAVMSKSAVHFWCRCLRNQNVHANIQDKPRSGQPRSVRTPETAAKIRECLQQDGRRTLSEVAAQVNISRSSAHTIMKKDLKFSKLCPKFVPQILTQEQKRARVAMCEDNLRRCLDEEDFMARIVTGDESWVSVFEMERKTKSKVWMRGGRNVIRPQKALRNRSVKKAMLTVFFDCRGVVLAQFKAQNKNVNSENYCALLASLHDKIHRKRPDLWRGGRGNSRFLIHHDNASPHTAIPTLAFLGEHDMEMVAHPPYSPDLAPCNFFLFPRLKDSLRGHRFESLDAMKAGVVAQLNRIDKDEFHKAIDQMPVRWIKCVESGGDYFEGRHINIAPEDPQEEDSDQDPVDIQFSQDDDHPVSESDSD